MSNPLTGAGIAARWVLFRQGIRKPPVVEATSSIAAASGDAPSALIATDWAKLLPDAPSKKNKTKSAKRFVK